MRALGSTKGKEQVTVIVIGATYTPARQGLGKRGATLFSVVVVAASVGKR